MTNIATKFLKKNIETTYDLVAPYITVRNKIFKKRIYNLYCSFLEGIVQLVQLGQRIMFSEDPQYHINADSSSRGLM